MTALVTSLARRPAIGDCLIRVPPEESKGTGPHDRRELPWRSDRLGAQNEWHDHCVKTGAMRESPLGTEHPHQSRA